MVGRRGLNDSARLICSQSNGEKYLAYVYVLGGLVTLGTSPLVGRLANRLGKARSC